jgi:hypothetical protein
MLNWLVNSAERLLEKPLLGAQPNAVTPDVNTSYVASKRVSGCLVCRTYSYLEGNEKNN